MNGDTKQPPAHAPASDEPTDLFGKLDSLIQKHQGRVPRRLVEGVPMLTEPIEDAPTPLEADIPVLEDSVEPNTSGDDPTPPLFAQARRQLQVALYLRLRQRLDRELEAALADDARLGAVAIDPAFSRVTQELRSVLPVVVRESVEQVFSIESLDALLARTSRGGSGS